MAEIAATRSDGMAVEVSGLTRRFGAFTAVDRIDLRIKKGEIFGFLGPNGSGKSTTIKMLCGLLLPSDGSGTVNGSDIRSGAEEIKRHIGYMSQRFSLYDDLTVDENIRFFGGVYSVADDKKDARRDWVLRMAGLETRRKDVTRTLPGGYKQRLALGCALLHEPPILFLDEPTSGTDPVSRRHFWSMIYEMAQGGTTVFVTTHYMDEADYCDRLALIYRGRIIAEGTPGTLRAAGVSGEVLEVDVDNPADALAVLDRHQIDAALFGSVLHVTVGRGGHGKERVAPMLADAGITVNSIGPIVPSLEDVFVALIEKA